MTAEQKRIFWGTWKSFDNGSVIQYHSREHITFTNPLLPPGQCIQSWYSLGSYQSERQVTPLPLLKRNTDYQLTIKMDEIPVGSIFVKVIYINRFMEEIGYEVSKDKEWVFHYPKDAYGYKIQLISAGNTRLDFYHLTIQEVGSSVES